MSELLELSAAEAIGRIEAGDFASDEYFDAYAEAAAGVCDRRPNMSP